MSRTCQTCGNTTLTTAVLKVVQAGKTHLKCTKCILFESANSLSTDSLSGTVAFTTNELSNADYNDLIDSVDLSDINIEGE